MSKLQNCVYVLLSQKDHQFYIGSTANLKQRLTDHLHKLGFARTYTNHSSLSAFDFLLRLNLLVEGKIGAILSDNGSEFSK